MAHPDVRGGGGSRCGGGVGLGGSNPASRISSYVSVHFQISG